MEDLVTQLRGAYSGKRVLVTGHNGFKGSWLVSLLNSLGAEVHGISLEIEPGSPFKVLHQDGPHKSYTQDIRDFEGLSYLVAKIDPHLVFHLAAQALVLDSYERPLETFEVNIQGTANLLEAVILTNSLGVVVATTDKVYKNDNSGGHFKESDELWGHDPYSLSKTGTELVVSAWRNLPRAHKCKFVTVRAGNVFGPGDRSPNRLIPDLVKGIGLQTEVVIRNPESVRPWQFVLDPLVGYLLVGEKIIHAETLSGAYNFGPNEESFVTVSTICNLFKMKAPVNLTTVHSEGNLEASILKLDYTLARRELLWEPRTNLERGLEVTVEMERELLDSKRISELFSTYFSRTFQ